MEVIPFTHLKCWLSIYDADTLLSALLARKDWTQGSIKMFGREVPEPRLTFFEGDYDVQYTYAHRTLHGQGWTPEIEALRDRFEREFGLRTNTVLGNLYRDGRDFMGWHRDHEPELGPDPKVVSLSLGATRDFDARRDTDKYTQRFALGHGDLLIMGTNSQSKWTHSIPKRLKNNNLRINLTFRLVIC